jgi:hypothetical protein
VRELAAWLRVEELRVESVEGEGATAVSGMVGESVSGSVGAALAD